MNDDTSELATSDVEATEQPLSLAKPSSDLAFSKIRRELSDDEFAGPAGPVVQRILLDRIAQLRLELNEEKPFRVRFHDVDKEKAVLSEKLKTRIASDVVSGICLSVGALLLGLANPLWKTPPFGAVVLSIGIVLILAAIASRVIVLRK